MVCTRIGEEEGGKGSAVDKLSEHLFAVTETKKTNEPWNQPEVQASPGVGNKTMNYVLYVPRDNI